MKRLLLILAATASLFATGLTWNATTEARDWGRPGYSRYYGGGYYGGGYYRPYSYGYRSYDYGYRPYYYRSYRPYNYGYPYGRGAYLGGPRAGVYFRY
jgi:hypothetical protein